VTEDQERLGARLLAFAALWLLLSGLLMVMSLVVVALAAVAVLLVVMLAIGGRLLLERFPVDEVFSNLLVAAARGAGRLGRRLRGLGIRRHVRRLGSHARKKAAGAPSRAEALLARGLRSYAITVYRLRARTSRLLRAADRLGAVGRRRQAFQLNELGAQLRRRGDPEHAVERHRVALEIVRDLGDEQAEALTLNSLALALAQGGAEAEAVEHLEQARVVLHELGDQEHEGQVIANLGLVYRRQGESEQAALLFQEALDTLPPGSWAYRQVKEELRRAS
jgi:tetratricopeptide (TPR) repeat protein